MRISYKAEFPQLWFTELDIFPDQASSTSSVAKQIWEVLVSARSLGELQSLSTL